MARRCAGSSKSSGRTSVPPSFPPPVLSAAPPCRNSLSFQFVMPAGLKFPVTRRPVCMRAATTLTSPYRRLRIFRNSAAPAASRRPPFVRAVSCGPYEGRMRDAIHALKYDRMHAAARRLGPMLAAAIAQLAPRCARRNCSSFPFRSIGQSTRTRIQPGSFSGQTRHRRALRKTHPGWSLILAPRAIMRVRATRSQAGLTHASTPSESSRRFQGPRSIRRGRQARSA